jgi:predicted GNAT family N-acyltransferase
MTRVALLHTVTGRAAACVARAHGRVARFASRLSMPRSAFEVVSADYKLDSAAIRSVRFAVFVDEQAVPAELEMDERDPHCLHVLALDANGSAVGTGRIDIADGGRIGRMAVLAVHRGCGVGKALIHALHVRALAHDCTEVWCHAQVAARSFYERAGYVAEGAVFEEAGIDHITMRCRLTR